MKSLLLYEVGRLSTLENNYLVIPVRQKVEEKEGTGVVVVVCGVSYLYGRPLFLLRTIYLVVFLDIRPISVAKPSTVEAMAV